MALFKKKPAQELSIKDIQLPEHIGIIMDGNGRWAKKRGLPRSAGHTAGAQTFRKIARYCSDIGIKYLTVYAFSTENWRRPSDEVDALMRLFKDYLQEAIRDFKDDSIVLRFIGDRSAFSPELLSLMNENEEESRERDGMVLNIAMNYGGRAELVTAIRDMANEVKDGSLDPAAITEELVSQHLYTKGQPDPDLIIRPSGENRTSNFLLWQSAYAEYVIMDVLWPDFTQDDLNQALIEFAKRNRRFGGV
ncbi:isoprenyl transferase [Ruminococcus sp.]|uniref:isoprenyl transferase n=1 Tax=Ruminococcus sp. TaxID=41978 RepID=UPI00292D51EF|nr:isoprenyl transferase [uncultured Ruminococcus sp.]